MPLTTIAEKSPLKQSRDRLILAVSDAYTARNMRSSFITDGFQVSLLGDQDSALHEAQPDLLVIEARLLDEAIRNQLRNYPMHQPLLVIILVGSKQTEYFSNVYPHDYHAICLADDITDAHLVQVARWHLTQLRNSYRLEQKCSELKQLFADAKDEYDESERQKNELQQTDSASQNALRALRERFHRLIDANPSVIYATDLKRDYACLFVSRRLKSLLDYEPEEMIKDKNFWFEHLHPDERRAVTEAFRQQSERGMGTLFYRFRSKSGQYKHIRDDFSTIYDAAGKPLEMVGVWTDISSEKQLDRALRGMSQALNGKTGKEYFQAMALQMSTDLELECVVIGEFTAGSDTVNSLALAVDNRLLPDTHFSLQDSPCMSHQKTSDVHMVSEGVRRRYPNDRLLVECQAESYFGINLYSKLGKVIGYIGLSGKRAVHEVALIELVLHAYADGVSSELERLQVFRQLQDREKSMAQLFEGNASGILEVDQKGGILQANPRACQILGYDAVDELLGQNMSILLPVDMRASHEKHMGRYFSAPKVRNMANGMNFTGLRRSGEEVPLEIYLAPIEYGDVTRVIVTIIDVTTQREQEQTILDLNRAYTLLSDCNQALVHGHSKLGLLEKVCGIAVEVGEYELVWIAMPDKQDERLEVITSAGMDTYLQDCEFSLLTDKREQGEASVEAFLRDQSVVTAALPADSDQLWVSGAQKLGIQAIAAFPLHAAGKVNGILGFCTSRPKRFSGEELRLLEEIAGDLSYGLEQLELEHQRVKAEQVVNQLAYCNQVTGLPNRARFTEDLAEAISSVPSFAVALIKLGMLSDVNNSMGYAYGDELLKRVAARLRETQTSDIILAHLGAGVFAMYFQGDFSGLQIVEKVSSALQCLSDSIELNSVPVNVSYRAGIVMMPSDGKDPETLLRRADIAQKSAMNTGEVALFSPDLEPDTADLILQSELVSAMDNNQLQLYYQPKLNIKSGQVESVEALIRWFHPEKGIIPPDKFIWLAEKTGLIRLITRQVLQLATRQLALWQAQGLELDIAVNVSLLDLVYEDFPQMLDDICKTAGVNQQHLIVELTETQSLNDVDAIQKAVQSLREMGVRLSIDDFGTGYSSMTRLIEMAVSEIKIDQSFVKGYLQSDGSRAIVRAAIELGHELGLRVVAEGVEDEEISQALQSAGCDLIQGYHISRPVEAAEFEQWLAERVSSQVH